MLMQQLERLLELKDLRLNDNRLIAIPDLKRYTLPHPIDGITIGDTR
jgi:hypothetical protein